VAGCVSERSPAGGTAPAPGIPEIFKVAPSQVDCSSV
jgi:hypothetical protein